VRGGGEWSKPMTLAVELTWQGRMRRLGTADWMALAVAFALAAVVAVRWHSYQWDFYMFYGSAEDFAHGLSPYRGRGLSFYHPPLTLFLYGLFARLPFPVAYELWFTLKLAALAGLFVIWSRHFLKLEYGWRTTLFFILAYNGTIYADLSSGNVSIFEQLGLWMGFVALLKRRYAQFCVCLILVAQIKLTPIFFACLLLLAPPRPEWKWFAACIAGFVGLALSNYLLEPELMRDFWRVAPSLDERGTLAPGTLACIRDVFDQVGGAAYSDQTRADELIYLVVAAGVVVASFVVVMKYRRVTAAPDPKSIVYFACLVYALAAPRMRVYSHILVLMPTLHLLRVLPRRNLVPAIPALLLALVVLPVGDSLLPFRALSRFFYEYLPLVGVIGVWLGFGRVLRPEGLPVVMESVVAVEPAG
jgi:hypothetical protein